MSRFLPSQWSLQSVVQGILGTLGVLAIFRFVPRILRFLTQRFFTGLIAEIVFTAIAAIVARKTIGRSSRNGQPES